MLQKLQQDQGSRSTEVFPNLRQSCQKGVCDKILFEACFCIFHDLVQNVLREVGGETGACGTAQRRSFGINTVAALLWPFPAYYRAKKVILHVACAESSQSRSEETVMMTSSWLEICRYTVFKLSAGAYFKYSSGGTPVLLFALGYGTEGKNDVGETYDFVLGDERALPAAATLGMVGMRVGGPLLPRFLLHCLAPVAE
jgi:hypothetical protein